MLDLGSSSPGYETGHTPFIDLDSEYMGEHDEEDGGFQTKYGQKGSVTRMPRPHAYTQYPEEGTPQRLIDEMQD